MQDQLYQRVLLVEDDDELATMVAEFLHPNGFDVLIERNGKRAVDLIREKSFDVLLLDINLPGMDGFSICRTVRSGFKGPILILTARGDEVDEVIGLEVGADDYMIKPVRPRALLARLRAHLRKPSSQENERRSITLDDMVVDSGKRVATISDRDLGLTTAEFDLLWLLAENAGEVVSRTLISEKLNGVPYDGYDRSIDLRISRLRRKLDDDPRQPERIKSVRGVGYFLSRDK